MGAFIAFDAGKSLIFRQPPSESSVGIILACASLIVMPVLAFFKIKAAQKLTSRSLEAEAKETLACSYLSFALLLGLSMNAINPDLWWSDPAAALLMVPWLIREGKEAFEKEKED